MKLKEAVVECLKEASGQRMKAREIADWIWLRYPDACQQKMQRSTAINTDAELRQQLVAEIGANRPLFERSYPQLKTTEDRPRLYYWSEQTDEAEVNVAEGVSRPPERSADPVGQQREHDLYPLVSSFAWSEFGVLTRRIDEKSSSNRRGPQGNHWLFPDLVGMEDLTHDWHQEVRDLVSHSGAQKARLWSFEVKLLLNRANVRESYFQTVSNSSWAHFGYLVAPTIQGVDTIRELRMLSALHGIGVIKLDVENPPESQVLIPSRERPDIDWANCNRLADENRDFRQVVKLVRQFHQTGDPRPKDWDAVGSG